MKKTISILALSLLLAFSACADRFNSEKAEELLKKSTLTESEYSELLEIYEKGMDDVMKFASEDNEKLSEKDREEMITMFAIGKRLMVDEDKLTSAQTDEFERITKKGTEELQK